MDNYILTQDGKLHVVPDAELYHSGVKGMKWGVRRYQNKDGSLTPAGKKRYSSDVGEARTAYKQAKKEFNKSYNTAHNKALAAYSPFKKHRQANDKRWEDAMNKADAMNEAKDNLRGAKATRKLERKYARAGKNLGTADYYREKGAQAAEKHNRTAEVFEKQAKKSESKGEYFKAEASRRTAEAIRSRGANQKASQDQLAASAEKRANRITEKASSYATKKRVDVGKSRVDSILNESRKKGYENTKAADEARQDMEFRNKYGDTAANARDKIRGK